MLVSAVPSAASSALLSGRVVPIKFVTAHWVNVVNGVTKSNVAQKVLAPTRSNPPAGVALASGVAALGSPASPLTLSMGYVGYNQRGATAVLSDINPANVDMPTITVKAHLVKGFSYSVASSFSYLRYAKVPTAHLSVTGPSDTKATALNLKGGSFTAKETGDYTFSWSLNNGASFDGAFSATIEGKAPALPKTTGNTSIDAVLQRQASWWHDQGTTPTLGTTQVMPKVFALAAGSSRSVLSYSFMSANTVPAEILKNDYPSTGMDKQFAAMDANQQAAARAAMDYISSVTNLTFTEATDGSGNLQFGAYNMDPQAGGQAGLDGVSSLPDSYPVTDKVYTFVNSKPNGDLGNSAPGTLGWSDIWHEIGHALGLKHPGNYDATGGAVSGPFLPAATDNQQYSIMSYKTNAHSLGANNLSYMPYDVAALQYLYGVNTAGSTASGGVAGAGKSFTFSSTDSELCTLYSATGTDTIDLAGLSNGSKVNLNAGTYSSINILCAENRAGGQYSGNQNVAIAYGSTINKISLSTSAASDTVVLNAAFKQGAFDEINNLQTSDHIALSKAIFGSLAAKNIDIGSTGSASTKNSRIVVNQNTGDIFYDADGTGTRYAAVKIACYQAVQGAAISSSTFAFLA